MCVGFAVVYYKKKTLFDNQWILKAWWIMGPSGIIAILCGWFVTEVGSQPYTVYGVLKTKDSLTPSLDGPEVFWSLLGFIIVYFFVFGGGMYYLRRLILRGVSTHVA